MPQRTLTTDEEVNSAIESGMYHVFGENGISVVLNYSIMIVFNDIRGYIIQMAFRLGADVVGFRRCFSGEWGDFRTFVLDS
ncbi:pyocin knob domain-containing protein [Phocaeicola sartorii]|uniref:pyocin knob domain-containing protein n=1 Tax=Phocaeicola sartorii TaxID=671267 RepID=UPI00248AE73B|nr:pyocin knob domain-containing protein [Phocaeicola sartorii]